MATKAGIFDYTEANYPLTELRELGVGLGMGEWDRDREFIELGTVLVALNVDGDMLAPDFTALEGTEGQLSSSSNMPTTINTVRRGILCKKLPAEAVVDPSIEAELIGQDSRGIWGDDGKIAAFSSGILLATFVSGLARGGFPKHTSKSILRSQIEHVLQSECDGRSSYAAVGAMRYLYRVMKYAELHTPDTRIAQIRRGVHLVRTFGLQLTDF